MRGRNGRRAPAIIERATVAATMAAMTTVATPGVATAQEGPFGGTSSIGALSVGSVLAVGQNVGGLCEFPETVVVGSTESSAITLEVTEACALRVAAIDESAADVTIEGPASAFVDDDPVAAAAFATEAATLGGSGWDAEPRVKVARAGHTKYTILEQFGITAYEIRINVRGQQDTYSGNLSGGTYDGYCYASGFPGNKISNCHGRMPSRGGSYIEGWARGTFDNSVVGGPRMRLYAQHDITRTSWAGRCAMEEGSLPPFWRAECKINKDQ